MAAPKASSVPKRPPLWQRTTDTVWGHEEEVVKDMQRLRPRIVAWWCAGFLLLIPAWIVNFLAEGSSSLVSGLAGQEEWLLAYAVTVVLLSGWTMWMGARILTRYGPISGPEYMEKRTLRTLEVARAQERVAPGSHGAARSPERQPAALLVVHGVGVQERYQTMDSVIRGLTESDSGASGAMSFTHVGKCSVESASEHLTEEDCLGQSLVSKAGTLNLFELYWAPMVEGVEGLTKWTDVLTWAGSMVGRLPRRIERLFTGSRALPHPREVTDEGLRRWVAQSHSYVRRKVGYTILYIGFLTVVLGMIAGGGLYAWRAGIMLQSDPAVAQKAALNVLDELVAMPGVKAVVDDWPNLKATTHKGRIREYFEQQPDDHPLKLFCQGCETWPKLRLAALLGSGVSVGTYFAVTKDAIMAQGLRSLVVLGLLVSFVYWASHSISAFVKSGGKYLRIADLHQDKPHYHRSKLRSSGRALLGGGIYLALLTIAVAEVVMSRGPKAEPNGETWLLSLTLMMVVAGISYLVIFAGVIPFLTRYIADIPIQANPSSYSPGAKVRKAINDKAVAMLSTLLEKYPSVVVLAHSQGTVVTYEMFHRYSQRLQKGEKLPGLERVKAYVTIGVALSKVQELVQGYDDLSFNHRVINARLFDTVGIEGVEAYYKTEGSIRWYNYWFQSDLVANPIRDYMPVDETKLDWYVSLLNPKSLWTHSDYWDCVEFYRKLKGGALRLALEKRT